MKAPMTETDALLWLKASADSEPELPAQITDRLWSRLSRDLGTGFVCAGAATSGAHVAATASAPAAQSVNPGASEPAAASIGAGSLVASTGANSVSGIWISGVASRLAIWSAPALVVGAAAGAIGHASLATVKGWTVDADRIASTPEVSNDDARASTSTGERDRAETAPHGAGLHQDNTPAATATSNGAPAVAAKSGAVGNPPSNGALAAAANSGNVANPSISGASTSHSGAPTTSSNTGAAAASNGAPAESALSRERAVLDKARGELAAGEPARALQRAQQHARLFPGGVLSEEREAIAINALVRMGDYATATKRAAAFRSRYPQSLMTHSVEAAIAAAK